MLSSRVQSADGRRQAAGNWRFAVSCLLLTASCFLLSGCRRDMQDQPKAIAYRENSFTKTAPARGL